MPIWGAVERKEDFEFCKELLLTYRIVFFFFFRR